MIKTVNMTSFTVNDKLKEFIHYIKTHTDVSSLLLNNRSYIDMLNTQHHLKEMFVEKQYDGMLPKGKKLKLNSNQNPEFYALMLLFISDIEHCDDWYDVMADIKKHVQLNGFENNEIRQHYGIDISMNTFCACGKFLCSGEIFKIQNKQTNMSLLLGNACIYKGKIATRRDTNALKNQKIEQAERFRESQERELMAKNDLKETTNIIQMNTYCVYMCE